MTSLILLLAVSSSACYQYFEIEDAAPLPQPGTEVRVQLTAPQRLELGNVTVNDVGRIEGDVYRSKGDTLALFSRRIFSAYGFNRYTDGAVFYFDRSQFSRIEQRNLAPVQTAIAVAAITAGALATMRIALAIGGGAEGGGPKDGPGFGRVFAIPFGWIVP